MWSTSYRLSEFYSFREACVLHLCASFYINGELNSAWIHMFSYLTANSEFNQVSMLLMFVFYLGYLEVRSQVMFIVLHSQLLRQFIGGVDTERHLNSKVPLQTIWIKSTLNTSSCNHIAKADCILVTQDHFKVIFLHSFLIKPSFLLKLLLCHPKAKS